ncbi:TlpA disulfide reductase family protein [Coraliomargarita sp. SDUM461004]|uniref:TlpA disulfide reductase family protein n=1 Tax=Thalassobacterium sedimentorum TaxID=3041258 RepID=A0ABU1AQ30_9BACT|nr:TlpA disulfide reductase family protein [Coraliomargarita sp. SDUM461004]
MSALRIVLLALFGHTLCLADEDYIESFTFASIGEGAEFRSSDHPDAILVLDFFAPWCAPCVGTSRLVDSEIRQHYARSSSDPTVVVLAVNVDQRRPSQLARFLERAELEVAYEDLEGAMFESFDSGGLPFIVVLTPESEGQHREVSFRQLGMKDGSGLREAIDALRQQLNLPQLISEDVATPDFSKPKALLEDENEVLTTGLLASREVLDTTLPEYAPPESIVAASDGLFPQLDVLSEVASGSVEPETVVDATGAKLIFQRFDQATEYMETDDIRILQSDFQWELQMESIRLTQLLSLGQIQVDYEPSSKSIFGHSEELDRDNWSYTSTAAWIGEHNTASLSVGGGEGYQDYRSLWLAEFYRQDFDGDPAYSNPDPHSVFVSLLGDWLFWENQLKLTLSVGYRWDEIAPSYSRVVTFEPVFGIDTEVGNESLKTASFGFESDWIATERTRIIARIGLDDTTDRDSRWTGDLTVSQVLGDSWVASLRAIGVTEGNAFHALSVTGAIDYDWEESWFLGLSMRYYEDNGLVVDPGAVSTESPELSSFRFGGRVAKVWERVAISLAAYHYQSRYEPVSPNSWQFENLYQDRDWVQLEFALSFEF